MERGSLFLRAELDFMLNHGSKHRFSRNPGNEKDATI